jgi:hypothetical protein
MAHSQPEEFFMRMKIFGTSFFICFFLNSASAQVASFTEDEIRAHQQNIHQITAVASDCLDWVYQDHLDFFNKWGVSKYYGNRRPDYKNREGLIKALRLYNKPANLVEQLEPISCIGLTLRCLREGFDAAGLSTTYAKINNELKKENRFYGTDLQKNLIRLGWKSFYWNPNPVQNKEWDQEDQQLNPLAPGKKWNAVWGGHHLRYLQATQKGFYFEKDLIIHDAVSLVGFNETQPDFFREVPFFVGIAHAGYHVFPGRKGEVIEAHSMRNLNAKDNLEYSEFNPLQAGGGPKWTAKEKYRSGVYCDSQLLGLALI